MGSLTFTRLTREVEIGANCYMLDGAGARLVLESGLHPKLDGRIALPQFERIAPDSVTAVVVTHAHQDHIGSLPVLQRTQPRAPVFMSEGTRQLGGIMLHNSVNVMQRKREQGMTDYPLFGHREVDRAEKRWQAAPLQTRFDFSGERLASGDEVPSLEFFDAGHLLGSVGVRIRAEGRTIFYTGDVQFDDQTLSCAARFPEDPVDVLIMECTRGDHGVDPGWTRAGEEARLVERINAVFARGGGVLIPTFALGKTQEVLTMLFESRQKGLIRRDCPIYIGGLSAKLSEVYDRLSGQTRRQHPNLRLLEEVAPFVLSGQSAGEAPMRGGRIYALSSGMMTENTLSNLFAGKVMEHREHAIFFIGYCDPATPGGRIIDAAHGATIGLGESQPSRRLECEVERFHFSGHATRESLRDYVNRVRPKTVLLVHGEPAAAAWFVETLGHDLPGTRVLVPGPGEKIEL